ncbi:MAG: MFS transporter [Deltaproteobacteria bacterium]|nr:MFS transporter [Deltaproteobacteria bacterium]
MTLLEQFKSFKRPFWAANIMEMFERLAYYGVRVVIPIYIASSEDPHGLHFTHVQKGQIFAWWALFQSLVPMFTGGFADRYGYKKTIGVSISIKIAGYLLMATQREFYPFLGGCLMLATGTAIFKPGIQGTLVQGLNRKNSSVGWGVFYQLVNLGAFFGPPLAGFLHRLSWPHVFYGCAIIVSLNYLMLFAYKEVSSGGGVTGSPWEVIKLTFKEFMKPSLVIFILIMSGFWLMLNQLWDMLPNFIEDWIDTSKLVETLGLTPGLIVAQTNRGLQINQEWLINLNAGLIVLIMVPVAALTGKIRRLNSIILGIALASMGLVMSGYSMSGVFCIMGIVVFSIGEMASSPKMNEYLGVIAPEGKKALYLGYANVPLAIGWFYGSIAGGQVYEARGDKAVLALRFMREQLGFAPDVMANVPKTEAMAKLVTALGKTHSEVTQILWSFYTPYKLWYGFTAVGIAAAAGMIIYSQFAKKWAAVDA